MAQRSTRQYSIELLRAVAITAIAIFHTFLPYNETAEALSHIYNGGALTALGWIGFLGAAGNHVFFLISGYFLIPRCAQALTHPSWAAFRAQCAKSFGRALRLLAILLFYALILLAISTWIVPLPGISAASLSWLGMNLEFIWLYIVFIAITPIVALLWQAAPKHRRTIVLALFVLTYLINGYIAFVSPDDAARSLLSWKKLMSGWTYCITYVGGAALSDWTRKCPLSRRKCRTALIVVAAFSIVVCGIYAVSNSIDVLIALSYKSTSLISLLLALTAFCFARTYTNQPKQSVGTTIILKTAQSTLAFYIIQSLSWTSWQAFIGAVLASILASAPASWGSFFGIGILFSAAFIAVATLFDQLIRIPLFNLIRKHTRSSQRR